MMEVSYPVILNDNVYPECSSKCVNIVIEIWNSI